MKKIIIILFVIFSSTAFGQSKKMMEAMSNAKMLEHLMFETKESGRLDVLFAQTLSYTDQDGKIYSREDALKDIVNSKLVYTNMNIPMPYDVSELNDSMIVKHVYNTTEKKEDGTETVLKLSVRSVWAKENGKLKLFRCVVAKL